MLPQVTKEVAVTLAKFLLDEAGIRLGVVTAAPTNVLAEGLPAKYALGSLPGRGEGARHRVWHVHGMHACH